MGGIWLDLENYVRTWAWEYGAIYIVTGPLFDDENYTTIGENEVAVPDYFFKVILDNSSSNKKAAGFIIPNEAVKQPVQDFLVNIDTVEQATGFDFFS